MTINSNDQRAILEDPESIRMIGVYESADCKPFYEHVKHLRLKYPELCDVIKEDSDPLMELKRFRKDYGELQLVMKQVSGELGIIEEMGGEERLSEQYKLVKEAVEKFNSNKRLLERYLGLAEEFYVNLANAIKDFSKLYRVSIEELVKSEKNRDEITKKVFPTRKEIENNFELNQLFSKLSVEVLGRILTLFINGLNTSRKPVAHSTEVWEVYQTACKEYWYNVFDRIYGKKEDVQ